MKSSYNYNAARSSKQLEKMVGLAKRGVCIFCREHVERECTEPIEYETGHWYVKKNDFPYEHTLHHLLIIPKQHYKSISELPVSARSEFFEAVSCIEKAYMLKSYALGLRSGDIHHNGGSIEHLHAHLIVGDTSARDHEPVRFKMSSKPAKS